MKEVVVVSGVRTAIGTFGGSLKDVPPTRLAALVTREALARAKVDGKDVEHVVFGHVVNTEPRDMYMARVAAIEGGCPHETPALTVNRLCGSGLQSVISAAQQLQTGEATWVLAGGMENMSQAPHVIRGARGGLRLGQGELEDSLMVALRDSYCGLFMAQTSDNLARKYGITREQQDAYALRSHTLGNQATQNGRFAEEIVPVEVKQGRKSVMVERDDHLFPSTSAEALAKLPPAFGPESFVTAGNASGIVDGAAALVVTTAERARAAGRKPLATVRAWASVGVDPSTMGIGPAPAIRKALEKLGVDLAAIDLFEINEAFSGQFLAVEKELGLARDKVNVNGGAIALGHPLGATGTRLIYTLALELAKRGRRWGVASACIGGGQGIAVVLERA